jgi:hypothetical protein
MMNVSPKSPDGQPGLIFGIYPGMTGVEETNVIAPGPIPDDPLRTKAALAGLESGAAPLLVRCYLIHRGGPQPALATPVDPAVYATDGRRLDLVLCCRSASGNVEEWLDYVRGMVARYGTLCDAIQVTEEPNNPNADTGGDGATPNVRRAMIEGVVAAKAEARSLGLQLNVGVAFVPSFNPADEFWTDVGRRITPEFLAALDYVGLDFFPDVFRPVPFEQIEAAVEAVLGHFRHVNLAAGAIPASVPIRITENGWPTGEGRPPERQAEILERVVRTIHALRSSLNITHYQHFMLRDGNSMRPDMGSQWGLLRHDYIPKPAYHVFKQLIAELGNAANARSHIEAQP